MKIIPIVLLSAAAAFAAGVPAQDPPAPARPPAQAPAKSVTQWIQDLGSDSYRTRLEAERALRQMGDEAVTELRQAAESSDDAEVQWRARRVLRQIERGGDAALEQRSVPRGGDDRDERAGRDGPDGRAPRRVLQWDGSDPDAMREHFESLFEQFERDFGLDIPRARFFNDGFFQDLQDQLRSGAARSQAMSMQIGPDGAVRVEVEEQGEDGQPAKKVYEAPDMQTFREKYPDVLRRTGLGRGLLPGGGTFFFGGPTRPWGAIDEGRDPALAPDGGQPGERGWRMLTPRRAAQGDADAFELVPRTAPLPPAGKRLGVTIRDQIPADVRDYLELDEDVGLWVEDVQPDSLAQALGLQPGDIVLEIGGRPIGSPQDVQQALGAINKGAKVEVAFVRKGAHQTASATKTAGPDDEADGSKSKSTPPAEAKPEKAGAGTKGEKRDDTIR